MEPVALVALLPLGYLAIQIAGSRDAHRFVIGFGVAAVSWFAILYPNISALPLPSAVVAAYQGILPTYLYAFQFPVSTVDRSVATPLLTPMFVVLTVAIAVTCLVVAYSTWSWRLAAAEAIDDSADDADADALARSGGGRLRDLGAVARGERPGRGQPADDEAVVLLHLGRDPRPAELLGPGLAGRPHLRAHDRVVEEPHDRLGDALRVARRDEQALPAPADDALVAVDVRRDDRRARGHRLEQHDPERLAPGGRRASRRPRSGTAAPSPRRSRDPRKTTPWRPRVATYRLASRSCGPEPTTSNRVP